MSSMRGGLTLAVASAATFGTSGTFAAALLAGGWSPAAAVTVRIAVSALVLTVPGILVLRGRPGLLAASGWRIGAYGFAAVAGCQLCYFNAIQRMPVGTALLLEYLATVLVVAWMWLRHGQRPRWLTVSGGCAALTGLALMLGVTGTAGINFIGVLWGLAAALCLTVYFTLSSGSDSVPPVVMAWGGMVTGALVLGVAGLAGALPFRAHAADVVLLGHRVSWIVPVLGLSLVASAFAYVAGIGAARRLGARLASFAGLSEVMFAVLFAWILLGQLPTAGQFAGGALILAGVAAVRLDERSEPTAAEEREAPAGYTSGARPSLAAVTADSSARSHSSTDLASDSR
jgi:drug/metabolite transporter (DMT)-like permease